MADGHPAFPDNWIVEFIDATMSNNYGSVPFLALDIGSNLGLVSLRLLQKGAHLIAVEPQVDLCCAGLASAIYNGFGGKTLQLCGGASVGKIEPDAMLHVPDHAYRYGAEAGYAAKSLDAHGLPHDSPLYPLDTILDLTPMMGSHFAFIKIDTDSIDCLILRQLLDRQRNMDLSFNSAALEVWAGPHCDSNEQFSQLLFDLQEDGYDIYRTPAVSGGESLISPPGMYPVRDDYPTLTESRVDLGQTTLLLFKRFSLDEWKEVPKLWTTQNQMAVTKVNSSILSSFYDRMEAK